jgi:hypothetical protein
VASHSPHDTHLRSSRRLSRRRRRIAQAVDRAIALFEAAFEPDHKGFLDAYWWPGEGADDEGKQLLALVPDALRDGTERNAGVNFWGDPDGDDAFARVTAALAPRRLDYESLFRLIARNELGLDPSLAARTYIVNESEPVIFLMYDDRGAIVHAPTAERLRPFYERFGDWLVDEWRPQMDAIFAQA